VTRRLLTFAALAVAAAACLVPVRASGDLVHVNHDVRLVATQIATSARAATRSRATAGNLGVAPGTFALAPAAVLFLLLAAGARRSTRREWWRFGTRRRGPPDIVSHSI